jgi:hypothetical protein
MKCIRRLETAIVILSALIFLFAISVAAQPGSRRNRDDSRRQIANDTFRELMKVQRESHAPNPKADEERAARLRQIREDFRAIQDVNNRMMARAWKSESIDYDETSSMLAEINDKAVRLKNNLSLPHPEKLERQDVNAGGVKEFKSALLLMDRSLMSFVNNRIFRENVIEVNLVTEATRDLENVISFSSKLRKIAANLKTAQLNR